MWTGDRGKVLSERTTLDSLNFVRAFRSAKLMELIITPQQKNSSSFARMAWNVKLPKALIFYAQDGYNDDSSKPSLKEYLYRHMFFTPDAPPNLHTKVGLGISETWGKERDKEQTKQDTLIALIQLSSLSRH